MATRPGEPAGGSLKHDRRGGHRKGAGPATGSLLVELTVAMLCTGLVAAGVLTLVVDGARTFRARHRALETVFLTEAGADAVGAALEAAGAGLEGARAVSLQGERIPAASVGAASLRVVIPLGAAREAEPAAGGEQRLADVAGLEVDDLVVGVGLMDPETALPPAALPVGRIARIDRDRARGPSGGTVRVAWAAPEATLLDRCGEPRALLPVAVREIATRALAEGLQLRRRDLGGNWQPIVDRLDEVRLRELAEGVVEIVVRAALPDAPPRTARREMRLR